MLPLPGTLGGVRETDGATDANSRAGSQGKTGSDWIKSGVKLVGQHMTMSTPGRPNFRPPFYWSGVHRKIDR